MEITTQTIDQITVVEVSGELDGKTSPALLAQVKQLCQPGARMLLNMGRVTYLSSAGLRVLLMLYRQVASLKGEMILVELAPELIDTLSETGFLAYFTTRDTVTAGLTALHEEPGGKNDSIGDQIRAYRSASNPYLR
jgi:anti-sigma B factor antagonist